MTFAYRAMGHRNPRLFPLVALHRPNTPTGIAFLERVLGAVHAAIPEPLPAAQFFRALGYYLVGAVLDETSGYALGPSAAAPLSDDYIARMAPHLAAVAPYFKRDHWTGTFAQGLDALLAQI